MPPKDTKTAGHIAAGEEPAFPDRLSSLPFAPFLRPKTIPDRIMEALTTEEGYQTRFLPPHAVVRISADALRKRIPIDPVLVERFRETFYAPTDSVGAVPEFRCDENAIKNYLYAIQDYVLAIVLQDENLAKIREYYALTIAACGLMPVLDTLVQKLIGEWVIPGIAKAMHKLERRESSQVGQYDSVITGMRSSLAGYEDKSLAISQSYMQLEEFIYVLKARIQSCSDEEIATYSQLLSELKAAFYPGEPALVVTINREELAQRFQSISGLSFSEDRFIESGLLHNYTSLVNDNLAQMYRNLDDPDFALNRLHTASTQFLTTHQGVIDVSDVTNARPASHYREKTRLPLPSDPDANPIFAKAHGGIDFGETRIPKPQEDKAAARQRNAGRAARHAANADIAAADQQQMLGVGVEAAPKQTQSRWGSMARVAAGILAGALLAGIVLTAVAVTNGAALAAIPVVGPALGMAFGAIGAYVTANAAAAIGVTVAATVVTAAAAARSAEPGLLTRMWRGITKALGFGQKTAAHAEPAVPVVSDIAAAAEPAPAAMAEEDPIANIIVRTGRLRGILKQGSTATMVPALSSGEAASAAAASDAPEPAAAPASGRPIRSVYFPEDDRGVSALYVDRDMLAADKRFVPKRKASARIVLEAPEDPDYKGDAEAMSNTQHNITSEPVKERLVSANRGWVAEPPSGRVRP